MGFYLEAHQSLEDGQGWRQSWGKVLDVERVKKCHGSLGVTGMIMTWCKAWSPPAAEAAGEERAQLSLAP